MSIFPVKCFGWEIAFVISDNTNKVIAQFSFINLLRGQPCRRKLGIFVMKLVPLDRSATKPLGWPDLGSIVNSSALKDHFKRRSGLIFGIFVIPRRASASSFQAIYSDQCSAHDIILRLSDKPFVWYGNQFFSSKRNNFHTPQLCVSSAVG